MKQGLLIRSFLAPQLVELVSAGWARPSFISTAETRIEAPRYYEQFDRKEEIKVYIHFP